MDSTSPAKCYSAPMDGAVRVILVSALSPVLLVLALGGAASAAPASEPRAAQYQFQDITVPAAVEDEPRLGKLSVQKAPEYLDQGAAAWTGQRKCISCHTNGSYMVVRPALAETVGRPP